MNRYSPGLVYHGLLGFVVFAFVMAMHAGAFKLPEPGSAQQTAGITTAAR